MISRAIQFAIIAVVALYLADLSLKATQRHAHDLFVALRIKGN